MTSITWYGHATLGLETGGMHILIDPFFSGNPSATVTADRVRRFYDGSQVFAGDTHSRSRGGE